MNGIKKRFGSMGLVFVIAFLAVPGAAFPQAPSVEPRPNAVLKGLKSCAISIISCEKGLLNLYSADTFEEVASVPGGGGQGVAFSHDGRWVAAGGAHNTKDVLLWKTARLAGK